MAEPLWQPRSDLAARLLGLGSLAAGLAILYWQVAYPIAQARAHEPSISYSFALIGFGAMFTVLGVLWIVRGLAGYSWIRAVQGGRSAQITIALLTILVVLAVRWYLLRELTPLGYVEN